MHAHRWRHNYAHEWHRAGGNTGDLMLLLGWSSADMPRHYGASAAAEGAEPAPEATHLDPLQTEGVGSLLDRLLEQLDGADADEGEGHVFVTRYWVGAHPEGAIVLLILDADSVFQDVDNVDELIGYREQAIGVGQVRFDPGERDEASRAGSVRAVAHHDVGVRHLVDRRWFAGDRVEHGVCGDFADPDDVVAHRGQGWSGELAQRGVVPSDH
ncbi:phage integrase family site specific recombinase [Actinoplanes sp. SE50]|nr:phage integrase family site specific recombinase [Actinoplanes sp. SE50/110]ATO83138.1 phage integrase family site specific recombinase [Actinoplanes sp. SE50]SLM00545.1 hypothetical protein ACSP50_3778 [Actinoplanes sp. SE50/110]